MEHASSSTIETISTPCGVFAIDTVRDHKMATALASGRYPNQDLLTIAETFVAPTSVVVDVGAHIGTFAVPLRSKVSQVIAFEPVEEARLLLLQNAQQNAAVLEVVAKALGRARGTASVVVRNESNAGANTLVEGGSIEVSTLDTEVSHADFIKIDVEGMELEVLQGARDLLDRSRPVVLFEVNLSQLRSHHSSPQALESYFAACGYKLFVPLEKGKRFAHVKSIVLLTACIAPRAFLLRSESAPFDLVAVPHERTHQLRAVGFVTALREAVSANVRIKMHRLRAKFGW